MPKDHKIQSFWSYDVSKYVAESNPPMGSMRFEMGKHDSSWRRVQGFSSSVVRCLVIVTVFGQCAGGKPISETLQRALSAVRGPSPGAKKLLNIPEDGGLSKLANVSILSQWDN
uniref:SFRICE_016302 n=1 Tax=Spodoptera frugiperda TaxID=7108 RepID=A0A2H1VT36_SPOFR